MPHLSDVVVFAGASVALLVVPGPAVIYVITRSVHQGRASGLASVLGLGLGSFLQVLAAAAGLSVLIAQSAGVFNTVKIAGAAYLIVTGVIRLRARPEPITDATTPVVSLRRTFRQGVVVNLLNPKVSLFFLAFLPQFVDPHHGHSGLQTVVLGTTFVVIGLGTDSIYAFAASGLGGRFRQSERMRERLDRGAGVVFIGLGFTSLLTHRPERI